MADTLRDILASTRALLETKTAEFKNTTTEKEADKALENSRGEDNVTDRKDKLEADQPASEPKREAAISDNADADPATTESGGTSGTEAGKNEGNVTDRSDKLESEDSAPGTLTKKPAIEDNAYADKVANNAATIGNEILASIHAFQNKTAAAVKQAAEYACDKCEAKTKEDCKCEKEATTEPKAEAPKEAEGLNMELTTDVMAKIAAVILSQEDGEEIVERALAEAAGKEAAAETLAFLAQQSEMAEKQAAYDQGAADAQALINQHIYEAGIAVGQAQSKEAAAVAPLADDREFYYQLGQKAAQASIADLMGGAGPEMDVAPEEMGMEAGPEVGMEEGGDEDITMADVEEALQALIAEGQVSEEEAAQLMEYLAGAGGEEAPVEEEAPAEAPVEEAPVEEAAPTTDEGKVAAAGPATELLRAIQSLRASQEG